LLQGLLAAPELLAPEPVADASAAPPLYVELFYTNAAPVASAPATLTANSILPVSIEHKFRHKKGPDVVDTLINASLEIGICSSQTKAVLASVAVDLLPFGLGSSEIQDSLLPLQPADTEDAFKVCNCVAYVALYSHDNSAGTPSHKQLPGFSLRCHHPAICSTACCSTNHLSHVVHLTALQVLQGSTVSLSIKLMHQPTPSPPASAVSHTSSTNGSSTSGSAAAAAGAVPAGPVFEPYAPLSADEAAACNVLEFTPLAATMLPQQLPAAASNVNGALSFTIGLHVPGSSSSKAVVCSGGCLGEQQLAWNKRCRTYLSPATVQALKVGLQESTSI
jgi:hypothetical protein